MRLTEAIAIAKRALQICKRGKEGGVYHSKLEKFARENGFKVKVVSRVSEYIHSRDIVVHPRLQVVRLYTGYHPVQGRDGLFYKWYECLEIPYLINDLNIIKAVKVKEDKFEPLT